MPKVDEVYFRSPARKLGINEEDIKREALLKRRNAKKAAQEASEKLSKVRSAQESLRQEGIVKQGSVAPRIAIGQANTTPPVTPERDTASGTFKGKGNLGGTRSGEKAIKERARQLREEDGTLTIRESLDLANQEQLQSILSQREQIGQRVPVPQSQLQPQLGKVPAGLQSIRFRGPEGGILPPEVQVSQQTPIEPSVRENIATQADAAVKSGDPTLPKKVNQATVQKAVSEGKSQDEATAEGNAAEKEFKILGMDGKTALLTSLGVGLAVTAFAQDPRGAAAGLPAAIDAYQRPGKEREALNAASALQNRKLAQTDRELDIKEKIGLGRIKALSDKLAKGPSAKDRPTISEAASSKAVEDFISSNFDDFEIDDETKNDLSFQLRERSKLEGGSPTEILQKIILEQFSPQTDPGIFFDDTTLIRK